MKNSVGSEISDSRVDDFQSRYLAHQSHPGGKRDELIALVKERHSNRRFSDDQVKEEDLDAILDSLRHCPSSCDRFGVRVKVVQDRDLKTLFSGLAVGAAGFAYRAPTILMFFANPEAYKGGNNGDEVEYNSYIDGGVMIQTAMLVATSLGLHSCVVNPQIRPDNRDYFYKRFKPESWDKAIFTGAVCLGYPHSDIIQKTRRLIDTVVVE